MAGLILFNLKYATMQDNKYFSKEDIKDAPFSLLVNNIARVTKGDKGPAKLELNWDVVRELFDKHKAKMEKILYDSKLGTCFKINLWEPKEGAPDWLVFNCSLDDWEVRKGERDETPKEEKANFPG